jgi:hypothetical protein
LLAADALSAVDCARVGDDDTLHPPPSSFRAELRRAYARLMGGGGAPDDAFLQANAQTRCMNGKLLVCFVGANLPCGKINIARDNPAATAWCREHPGDKTIPLVATGHDTLYSYECDGANARVTGTSWVLDRRGFAVKLWTPLN